MFNAFLPLAAFYHQDQNLDFRAFSFQDTSKIIDGQGPRPAGMG